MSVVSTPFSIALPSGVNLTFHLDLDEEEDSISLLWQNFTIDPLGRVFIKQGTKQSIVGTTSSVSRSDGLRMGFALPSTEALSIPISS